MTLLVCLLLLILVQPSFAADYQRDVRPLLKRKCYACHSVLRQKGGLRLDTARHILRGGEGGPVVRPGKSRQSRLLERLLYPTGNVVATRVHSQRTGTLQEARLPRH